MDLASIIGLVGCNLLLIVSMQLAGSLLMFWDFLSLLIVLGGSSLATLMKFPLDRFLAAAGTVSSIFMNKNDDPTELIDEIMNLSQKARKESILSLEKVPIKNPFMAKAVKFMVDGYDGELINQILDLEIANAAQRHKDSRAIYESMGETCPAFGMIGTVIGLIVIMANLSDPNAIGPGLAVALVTTLYGSMIANVFFLPMAKKLEYRGKEDVKNMMIIKQGITGILGGDNPRAIQERLQTFLIAA